MLVSHFLFDLQEAHQRTVVGLGTDDILHISQSITVSSRSVHVAPALGSLAATIHHPTDYGWEGDNQEVAHGLPSPNELVIPAEAPRRGDGNSVRRD